jgi:diketogulonate reductase-like aldo/keto reductase
MCLQSYWRFVEAEEHDGSLGVVGVASNGMASMLANAEAYVLVCNYSMKTQNTHKHTYLPQRRNEGQCSKSRLPPQCYSTIMLRHNNATNTELCIITDKHSAVILIWYVIHMAGCRIREQFACIFWGNQTQCVAGYQHISTPITATPFDSIWQQSGSP